MIYRIKGLPGLTPPPAPPRNGEGSLPCPLREGGWGVRSMERGVSPALSGKGAGGLGQSWQS